MEITALPAFSDNYIWALRERDHVAIVDPGDATPVLDYLERSGGTLCAILITHHHADHIGGVKRLLQHAAAVIPIPVYGPAAEQAKITMLTHTLREGDSIDLPELDLQLAVLDVGGHTLGHIAYLGEDDDRPVLFCGDTLFAGGCGRLFEGTPQQMFNSLSKLAALPSDTRVYCAHEYTQANIKFALAVEPANEALQQRGREVSALRAADRPSVPSTLGTELATNPFLRWRSPAVIAAAREFSKDPKLQEPVAIFTAIREWKNVF